MSDSVDKAIERDYCAGVLKNTEICRKYGITIKALRYRVEKFKLVQEELTREERNKKRVDLGLKVGAEKREKCPKNNAPESRANDDEKSKLSESDSSDLREVKSDFDPDEYGLTLKEAKFVFHYLKTDSRVEAYRRAGFEGKGNTAYVGASRLYRKDKISKAIRALKKRIRERYSAELDEIVDQLVAITRADPNEVTQYRRVNCRYCWGDGHHYQWRDESEYDRAERKAAADSKPPPDYGGLGFVSVADPNPDCPRCNGEGEGEIKIADTRDLDAMASTITSV